ncbi:MAG: AAA family ATPase [Candidatus Hydrogenedentes bacterium]|nr:AAA family ATPase [Candidatus Hydrogenedentota bacterium]
MPPAPEYAFLKTAGRILNSRQSRSILLTGNIHDLFYQPQAGANAAYATLLDLLAEQWASPDRILIVYELNGPIRFVRAADRDKIRDAWLRWRTGLDVNQIAIERMLSNNKAAQEHQAIAIAYDANVQAAVGNPTVALELMRQMCLCSRTVVAGKPALAEDLLIIIEGADMLVPEGAITGLSDVDRHRVAVLHDWFSDPGFMNADDSVVLFAESRSQVHHRVAKLPQIVEAQVPSPDEPARMQCIEWFFTQGAPVQLWGSTGDLARQTAGLSIHALLQLLKGARHDARELSQQQVVAKVEEFIQSQLGEDIVEFKKPSHRLEDCVGFTNLKQFLRDELMPRFKSTGAEALSGAAVAGPIGGGKTFIFEAVAAELDMVVLVLKNIRSQWYGQTDVIFERLRRVLDALSKVLIFVDEADTQFGGVGADTHETERRLTGKIQAMMSDPKLRGRVVWLLMTARIHLLSPDIRRPGRVGDLIIPVLDPEGEDRRAFIAWAVGGVTDIELTEKAIDHLDELTPNYSSASFASLRSELKARAARTGAKLSLDSITGVVQDLIPPAITETRRYQTLQALVNCTRRSLLPDPNVSDREREQWSAEIRALEAKGIR